MSVWRISFENVCATRYDDTKRVCESPANRTDPSPLFTRRLIIFII